MMDPKLKYTTFSIDLRSVKNLSLFYSKVVSASKWKRFGQAWPGTFRLQVEALWLESSWKVFSMNGCVLLETVCKLRNRVDGWYSLVKDLIVWHFRMEMDDWIWTYKYVDVIIFQDEKRNGSRREYTGLFHYTWILSYFLETDHTTVMLFKKQLKTEYYKRKEGISFRDANGKESREKSIKYFYSSLRLHEGKCLAGVHGSSIRGGRGGNVLGRSQDSSRQEGRHLLVSYGVVAEHFQQGRLVLNKEKVRVFVELHQIHVVAINPGLVNKASGSKLRQGKLDVGVGLGLLAPDRKFGRVVLQSGAEQVVIGRTRVKISKPGNGRKNKFLVFKKGSKCGTYFTTMGDLALFVCLEALAINGGGILMLKWRADKSITMFTSFSPGTFLGTTGPANTRDLEFRNNQMFLFGSSLYLPYYIRSFQRQEFGVRLLLVAGHGLGQVLHLVSQDLDLGFEVRHIGIGVSAAMEVLSGIGKTIISAVWKIEVNILIASDLASQVWYEKIEKRINDDWIRRREKVESYRIKCYSYKIIVCFYV